MKAVDFIIEEPDRYLFIEVKDPQHPAGRDKDRKRFVDRFLRGGLDPDLIYKYRDTFLYEWSCGRARKPVYYLVLVALDTLTPTDLLARTDALKRQLPVGATAPESWSRSFVAGCAVLDIDAWNRHVSTYPVTRRRL
jgi:hypothetical protein